MWEDDLYVENQGEKPTNEVPSIPNPASGS